MPNLDSEQQLLLERVYRHRHDTGQWPRLQQLQRELASEQIDVGVRGTVLRTADHIGISNPDEQLRLTLKGLGAVPEANVEDLIALRFGLPLAEAEESGAREQQPAISLPASPSAMSTEPSRQPVPKRRPKTEKHLGRLVSQYAEAHGLGVRRVRQRVAAMALLGALERVHEDDSPARFLLKGGIACELRFRNQARATRDLDAIFHGSLEELLTELGAAFATPYSGFSFSYTQPTPVASWRT